MPGKKYIKDYTLEELRGIFERQAKPAFRANQIFENIYRGRRNDFREITNLPKDLRAELEDTYIIDALEPIEARRSLDGSVKFLFRMAGGDMIESVLMPYHSDEDSLAPERSTLCVSTQAGCPLRCRFCATGTLGFRRNLSPAEIVDQYLKAEAATDRRITNVVLMGMGEPLLNFDNVARALDIFTNPRADLVSRKKITLSTVGIIPKIYDLAEIANPVKLAVSLHSAIQEKREKLMPIARKFPLGELGNAVENYYRKTGLSITYEYILFDGINDGQRDADRLIKFARRVNSIVNIIPFNDVSFALESGAELRPAPVESVDRFVEYIRASGVVVKIRKSFGPDIEAACGQLALSRSKQ
ncbi:MAG: 23S rRNA (adenine(2503)-C(2))-methyltransferase RlmN [Candidatus Kapaibacterium sp.]